MATRSLGPQPGRLDRRLAPRRRPGLERSELRRLGAIDEPDGFERERGAIEMRQIWEIRRFDDQQAGAAIGKNMLQLGTA